MHLALSYSLIKSAGLVSRLLTGAYQTLGEDTNARMLRENYNASKGYDNLDYRGIKPSLTIAAAVTRNRKNPDIAPAGSPLTRVAIPAEQLTTDDLKSMGFVPSYAAVPERGQAELRTWRHPNAPMHLHRHSQDWLMHEDKWPSMAMLRRAELAKNPNASTFTTTQRVLKRSLTEGLPHVLFEGVPGYLNYISGTLSGQPTFGDALSATRSKRMFDPSARAVQVDSGFSRGQALHTLAAAGLLGSAAAAFKGSDTGASVAGGALGLVAGDQLSGLVQKQFPGVRDTGPGHFVIAGGIPLATAAAGALGGRAISKFIRQARADKSRPAEKDAVN